MLLLVLLSGATALAQEETFVSLNSENTTLQTGQAYDVQIVLENVTDLQVASVEVAYDPALLYVYGTSSGSPVQTGDFMGGTGALIVRNRINDNAVQFTVSRINPQPPVSGTGVAGTFRIYALSPGTAQLTFRQVALTALEIDVESGEASNPYELPFSPILLEFTINGDPVPVPDEATATPAPTFTPLLDGEVEVVETLQPTATDLLNITRAPATATPVPADVVPAEEVTTGILPCP